MEPPHDAYPNLLTWLSAARAGSFRQRPLFIEEWFLGRYQVEAVLGAGHTAVVLRAKDAQLDRTVALKVWHNLGRDIDSSVVLREGRILARLEHPHVVKVHDFGIDEEAETPWMVLEYLGESTLHDRIQRADGPCTDGPKLLSVAMQVAELLDYLHGSADLFQLDLKPGNLAVTEGAGGLTVKLMDLGSAYRSDEDDPKRLGTPGYIAPEIFVDAPVDKPSDMYSLGVLMHELASGENPLRLRQESALGRARDATTDMPMTATVPIRRSPRAMLTDTHAVSIESDSTVHYQELLEWMRTTDFGTAHDRAVAPHEYNVLIRELTQTDPAKRPTARATRARLRQMMPKPPRVPTVFISHAHADKARFVDEFVSALRERGLDVWIDTDSLRTGQPFWEAIGDAIQQSDFVITVLSRSSLRSAGVNEELRTAQLYNLSEVKLLPIRIDPVAFEEIPHQLRSRHVLDFVGWGSAEAFRKKTDKLVSDIFALQRRSECAER